MTYALHPRDCSLPPGHTGNCIPGFVTDVTPHCVKGTLALSSLEKRGLVSLLSDAIDLLTPEFGKRVGNGDACRCCNAKGFGVPDEHDEDCRGVMLLNDLTAARNRFLEGKSK